MKNQRKKFYLTIPVFLGMLLASGKVAANETSVEQPPVPPTTEPSQATTITPAESSTVSETTPTVEASPAIAVRAAVETSATTPASQAPEESLPASGTYTFTERVGVKSEPKMSAPDRDYYTAGEKANYDKTVENDNHLWISYVSYSGSRSYVPVKELGTPTSSTPTETAKPVAEKAPAKVEVVGYDEYKTNFTIKVTGTPDTKQIAHVRAAVWSADKGQDDLKWYEPKIANNQASATVDIANHSNTSDKYTVHVYTTYTDNTTIGSNLGEFKISKNKPVAEKAPAKVEVVGYDEYKTNFTIKVTGTPDTKQIAHVRAAVWSADKGQDDLKWYEPKVVNNQASATVDIANHSNTSDKYTVHVYTTYTDNTTIGSNLGEFKISKNKPVAEKAPAKVEVVGYDEYKTNFTIKVTGTPDTKQIAHVRAAVWSTDKGQDDLKWYEPKVVNNQASATVDIANHSNTSDKYTVHVYTTYTDNTTIGSNLGEFKISKNKPVAEKAPAKVEVVDYDEYKTNFTIKVTGTPDTKQIAHVRAAVWSADKGQDDLKWYEPKVVNNQASATVDIANHSNTSDKYTVHVYTTYTDNTTIGSNLGEFKISKNKPVAEKVPAKVEVVGYDEYKTNFTIKVTGTPDTKQIAHVRAAVWSADKGQDDLKWYEPKVVNNQASATVDIANHSNTSDKYTVHVYTTYTDNTTIGSNLGEFKISKEVPKTTATESKEQTRPSDDKKLASIQVVDYKKDKGDFTVKVTQTEGGKSVKDVRIAVWSENKGQDDLKWYTPKVENKQANAKIYISNHSNTSDKYHVHVYTTYTDNQTVGTNLGAFEVIKPEPKLATIEVQDYQENKTYFTVKVTGSENSKEVKDVRVAVWSKDKGQDDVKWYTPEVTNNRAAATISIANHSNTSDQYTVHVYTTYSDGSTIGTDAGTFNIKKPNLATIYGTDQVNNVSDSIKKVLQIAGDLLGVEIGGAAHKKIVDDYNAVSPLPVGYKVAYDDDWCDVFTTVVFQRAGLSHLIGRECGVERHTNIFKSLGIWNEDGSTTPKTGDIITFNWDQNHQANDGFADHIGIVTHVQDGIIHTIEGNNDQQVRRRTYKIGHGNIRGFARPHYS